MKGLKKLLAVFLCTILAFISAFLQDIGLITVKPY